MVHLLFMALVALNLVGGFRSLGTLMSVGLLILPATAARCSRAMAPMGSRRRSLGTKLTPSGEGNRYCTTAATASWG